MNTTTTPAKPLSALELLARALASAREKGISNLPQLHALLLLGAEGNRTVTDLALKIGLSTAAVTGTLDRLESLGLILRRHDRTDRRKVYACLTQAGDQFTGTVRTLLSGLQPA